MEQKIDFTGLGPLQALLEALPPAFQKRALVPAVRSATYIILNAARVKLVMNRSIRTGLLYTSLGRKVKFYKRTGVAYGVVGPRVGWVGQFNGRRINPNKYAHLVEGGHLKADGTRVPPKPFLRTAKDENRAKIFRKMKAMSTKGLAREVARLRVLTRGKEKPRRALA